MTNSSKFTEIIKIEIAYKNAKWSHRNRSRKSDSNLKKFTEQNPKKTAVAINIKIRGHHIISKGRYTLNAFLYFAYKNVEFPLKINVARPTPICIVLKNFFLLGRCPK